MRLFQNLKSKTNKTTGVKFGTQISNENRVFAYVEILDQDFVPSGVASFAAEGAEYSAPNSIVEIVT